MYRKESDVLIIEVKDDGAGFDASKPADSKERRNKSGGIGMSNVNSRIKILCGQEYGLEIKSKVGEGTKVTIRLPIKTGVDMKESI